MRKRNLIWGILLLLVGLILLADNLDLLGFIQVSIWQLIAPLALIVFGAWVLWGTLVGSKAAVAAEHLHIPAEGTQRAEVTLNYGAGEFIVEGDAEPGAILSGDFQGGVEKRVTYSGDTLHVQLSTPPGSFGPWNWGPNQRRRWDVRLDAETPLSLTVKSGASDCRMDLTDLSVKELRLDTGASSTRVKLPARAGHTEVRGSSGAASVVLEVPEGVAARIRTSGGLASFNVNRHRFPRQGNIYISPDYEAAENTVDIEMDMGVGSVEIL